MRPHLGHAFLSVFLAGAGVAQAQPATFKCVDNGGRSTYTNVKEEMAGKKCAVVSREVSVVPAQPAGSATKAPPPTAARAANNDRRKILEEELSGEEKRLAEARDKLTEQQSQRSGDERNYQRVLERLKPFADAVELHEKNVAQLRRELNAAR
jgi:septal ring factor EnvC (AmiA/AmiB activator)